MFQADPHPRLTPQNDRRDAARADAQFSFNVDAMLSRRPRRPISLPRPPATRGR